MARLAVIGASGGIGLEMVKAALAAGHEVHAIARSASAIAIDHPALTRINADARTQAQIEVAIASCDCVVQSLGVALSPSTVLSGTTLFSEATRALVDAMARTGCKRLIAVTGLGSGDSRDQMGPLYRLAFEGSLRRIYDDKDVQEMIIRRSDLDWTVVRPGFLTNASSTTWNIVDRNAKSVSGSISRSAVADYILRHWNDPLTFKQSPIIVG